MNGMATCLALVAMAFLGGCGSSSYGDREPARQEAADFDVLVAQLAAAGPQGRISPAQAAATAARQEQIVRRYVATIGASRCATALRALARSYGRLADSARRPASATYATFAGEVASGFQAAQQACAAGRR